MSNTKELGFFGKVFREVKGVGKAAGIGFAAGAVGGTTMAGIGAAVKSKVNSKETILGMALIGAGVNTTIHVMDRLAGRK